MATSILRRRAVKIFLLLSVLVSLSFVGAAQADETSASPVQSFDGETEVDGTSILHRIGDQGRVAMTLETRELENNSPYTIWWVVFNNPELCDTPCACGDPDFANADEVGIGVFWATGRFSNNVGDADFAAQVDEGELPRGPDQVPFPDFASPLEDEDDAEIHLVVRAHGQPLSQQTQLRQLTEFDGGCPPNVCVDVQFAIHPSPSCTP